MDGRVRSRLVAALIAVCALVACLAWGMSSAPGSSPDEDFHMTSMWCPPPITASGCRVYYDDKGVPTAVYAPEKIAHSNCFAFRPSVSGACADDLSRSILVKTDRVDLGNYPGPYFRFAHAFAGDDVQASVGLLRLFNTLLAAVLIGSALVVVPLTLKPAVITALCCSLIPMVMFLVPSINPSSWAFSGLTAFWISCITLARGYGVRRRVAATVVALAGAVEACLARNDSIIFVLLGLAVTTVFYIKRPGAARDALRTAWPWLLVVPISLGVSVWSFLISTSSSGIAASADRAKRDPMTVLLYNITEAFQIPAGVLGTVNLGWSDTRMPADVWVSTLLVAGFLLLRGMSDLSWRKALALAGIAVTLLALPVYMLQRAMALMGDQVQPRYFMSAVPILLAVALFTGDGRHSLRLGRAAAISAWLLLSVANSIALLTNMRRYVSGLNGPYIVGSDQQWWWVGAPSPLVTWVLGSVAFGGAAFALVLLSTRDDRPLFVG